MKEPQVAPARRWRWMLALVAVISSLALPQERLRILLSNDDGYQHPGLRALVDRLAQENEVVVSAPAVNQSGVGHATTFREPIPVESWTDGNIRWHAVSASPATCVRLALEAFLKEPPDVVIAGVNSGENVGLVTYSSGTIACARDAAFRGLPAISVNIERGKVMDYAGAAEFVAGLLQDLRSKGLRAGTYLNINYPALPRDMVKGVLITRQDTRPPHEHYEMIVSPQGRVSYRSIWEPLRDGPRDTDTWALSHGYVSVTPLQIDQTHPGQLKELRSWISLRSFPAPTKGLSGQDK